MPTYTVKTGTHSNSTSDTHQRHLARKSNGDLWCSYSRSDGTRYQVYCAYSTDGGINWTEEQVSAAIGSYTQQEISIAIDSQDNVHVVWSGMGYGSFPSQYNIRYRKRTTTWQTIEEVTNKNGLQDYPTIAVDSSDNVHVAWCGIGYGTPPASYNYSVRYRKRTTSWQTEEAIADPSAEYAYRCDPAIAIDSSGNVHVTWWGQGYGTIPVYWNLQYRKRTTSWQTREAITDKSADQFNSSIVIDSAGNVHVIWQGKGWGANPTYYNIQYRKRTTSWQTQEAITDIAYSQQFGASLAIDASDNVHVVWRGQGWDTYPAKYNVEYRKRTGSWQTRVAITNRNYDQGRPSLIWALYPIVLTSKTNRPKTGYAIIWSGQIVSGYQVEYFCSDDLSWDTEAFELSCTDGLKVGDSRLRSMTAGLLRTDGIKTGSSPSDSMLAGLSKIDGMKVGDTRLQSMLAQLLKTEGIKLDSSTLIDLATVFFLSLASGLKVGDSSIESMLAQLLRVDSTKLSEVVSKTMTAGLSRTDNLSVDDTFSLYKMLSRIDGVKLRDSAVTPFPYTFPFNFFGTSFILIEMVANLQSVDAIKMDDSSIIEALMSLVRADSIKMQDSALVELWGILYLYLTDNLKIEDTRLVEMIASISQTDTVKIGDTRSILSNVLRADGMKFGGALLLSMFADLSQTDRIKIGDSRLIEKYVSLLRIDGIKLGDSRLISSLASLLRSDGVKLDDVSILSLLAKLDVVSGIKIGDISEFTRAGIYLSIIQGIKIGDSPTLTMLASLALIQAIKIGDTIAVGMLGELIRLWLSTRTYHNVKVFTKTYHDVEILTEPFHCVIIYTGDKNMTIRRNWQRAETVPIWAEVKLASTGALYNPDQGVVLNLTDPNGAAVLTDEVMTRDSLGMYVYYWNSVAASVLGWYKAKGLAQDGSGAEAKVTIEYGGFQLQ